MASSLRIYNGRTWTRLLSFQKRQQFPCSFHFFIHTTSYVRDKDSVSGSYSQNDILETRRNAIRERKPNYSGWWTEIMNRRTPPQSLPDPTLILSTDHVFKGQPLTAPSPAQPTESEVKKRYSNTLPTASKKIENTLPTAVPTGSATFATGSVSSLSKPTSESTMYHGFKIPVKPTPPGAEDCCMSGCAHCIYDIYEEERQEYKRELAKVLEDISKAGLPPPPSASAHGSNDGDGNSKNAEDDIDPGMKAFLELERKLKGS